LINEQGLGFSATVFIKRNGNLTSGAKYCSHVLQSRIGLREMGIRDTQPIEECIAILAWRHELQYETATAWTLRNEPL